MLGSFVYYNPVKIYFGEGALRFLEEELGNYGPVVQMTYGMGSIKKSGLYDKVVGILDRCGKTVVEDGGVMSNPTKERMMQGVRLARREHPDLLLAVGAGSVIDYTKAVARSVFCEEDPWECYWLGRKPIECSVIPVGSVLTMAGTGSEMDDDAVIMDPETMEKRSHVPGEKGLARFAVMDPVLTYSAPLRQMKAGIFDIMSHIMEQYFSGKDICTSDYVMEGLMRSLISASLRAVQDPCDYGARSDLMWISTWATNSFVEKGKPTDWQVHMIGHAISACTDATHGMTLSAVSLPYYRMLLPHVEWKFAAFARAVWDVTDAGLSDRERAEEGLRRMEAWMREIGVSLHLTELGVDAGNLEDIADHTLLKKNGYLPLSREKVLEILKRSL